MRLRDLRRFRWHMLTERHYWWKAYRKLRERLAPEQHLETLLEASIETAWSPPGRRRAGEGAARPLRILYVAHRYDYGNPARGLAYEENNFYHVLRALGHEMIRFDPQVIMARYGRRRMNEMLLEAAYRYGPDLLFATLFADEFDKETLQAIKSLGSVVTLNWFADDHWRFESFSRHWAPQFDWVTTTSREALGWYAAAGINNVILTQWACNQRLYYPMDLPKGYDVSFVGQPHGNRRAVIGALRAAGVKVHTWGYGWPEGKITQREMVQVFNRSKINLNLSNASVPGVEQIKGRVFEVPGCGGFLLTGYAAGLEEYYDLGREIVCYTDQADMLDKIRYYLAHDAEREAIARRGYERTLRDHTYDRRFAAIFEQIGLG